MKKHSVVILGHATSFSLEDEFWTELKRLAAANNTSVSGLIERIDKNRCENLSGAIRVYVLNALKQEIIQYKHAQ